MGNHDQNRVSARLGTDRIDMINMMLLTLPGASVTYYVCELIFDFKMILLITTILL